MSLNFPPNWVNLDEMLHFQCKSFLSAAALAQQYLTHRPRRQQEQSFLGLITDDKCGFQPLSPTCECTAAGSAAMDTRYQV